MKKLLGFALSIALILTLASAAFADHTAKIGYEFGANDNSSGTNTGVDSGLDIGYEYTFENGTFGSDALGLGLGVQYQFEKKLTNTEKKFSYIPVYGLVTYDVGPVYLTARLGYNLFTPNDTYKNSKDTTGGIYYAAGAGYRFQQFKVELLYEVNNASLNSSTVTDSAVAIKFGYTFLSNGGSTAQAPSPAAGNQASQKTEKATAPAPKANETKTVNDTKTANEPKTAAQTDATNNQPQMPGSVKAFLQKVKDGSVSMTDLRVMQDQLTEMADEQFATGNVAVDEFLAKVKSGTVTNNDLTNIKPQLNNISLE